MFRYNEGFFDFDDEDSADLFPNAESSEDLDEEYEHLFSYYENH